MQKTTSQAYAVSFYQAITECGQLAVSEGKNWLVRDGSRLVRESLTLSPCFLPSIPTLFPSFLSSLPPCLPPPSFSPPSFPLSSPPLHLSFSPPSLSETLDHCRESAGLELIGRLTSRSETYLRIHYFQNTLHAGGTYICDICVCITLYCREGSCILLQNDSEPFPSVLHCL